jgi:hypothetical protein
VKTPAAGERKLRLDDLRAGLLEAAERLGCAPELSRRSGRCRHGPLRKRPATAELGRVHLAE